jgi:hypothetical protein
MTKDTKCATQASYCFSWGIPPRHQAEGWHSACNTGTPRGLAGWRGQALPLEARRPQTPTRPQRIVVRMVFTGWAVCRGSGAVEGFPWPGRPRGWTQLGGRSPGLRLAAAVLPAGKQRNVRCARSCVKARLLPLLRRSSRAALRCAALTPAPSAWASPRKQEEQKLQRPAAYRPGERRARFSPPPLRRPWEAQPPLRVAAAHSPQKNASEEDCFFQIPPD